jgi:phosphoribosyl 1,2-cyclic phosphate phosphodiesterase
VIDSSQLKVTLMGTGTSTGVPVIGCTCPTCISTDLKDKRLRCSCYIEVGGIHLVIDVGPDFRGQAIKYGIKEVDAALITHHHFDHVAGLDDLRPFMFYNRASIPCYALKSTKDVMEEMFAYIFRDGNYPGVPKLELAEVHGPFVVQSRSGTASVAVIPIPIVHGSLEIIGYRIGNFAYLTDVSEVPFSSRPLLKGLDVLILDGLRDKPHPMHLTIDQSISVAEEIGAKQTWFTHIAHDLMHAEIEARMPAGMAPAYDGLQFTVD